MRMSDSQRLLADYANSGSELAFRELLTRYVDLVYSTALRLVGGDACLAQDVTQTVFADFLSAHSFGRPAFHDVGDSARPA
jgi:DNA-directed RNA polymerase specialized sigma24 family protein